jgi:RHS repeat-associated protein
MRIRMKICRLLVSAFGLPLIAHAQTYTKTETIEYHDDTTLWVLGQVKRTTTDGVETSRVDTYWKGRPVKIYAFGKFQKTIGYYNSSGNISHIVDGNNNLTAFFSWRRGIPQTIHHADGTIQYAAVSDAGLITSTTDQNGFVTSYDYDDMGRLAGIVYPSEDSTEWDATTRNFEQINDDEYGLSAGHWRLTEVTDDYRKVVYFDALWRPVVEQEEDLIDDVATLRWRNMRYDHDGRVTFASYPRNPYVDGWTDYTGAPWGGSQLPTPLAGMRTAYDALGRTIEVKQDSELGPLPTSTRYLSGFLTEVTDPRNQVTITGYMAYDQPTYDWPVSISHPEGAYTDIVRDVFGKPKTLTRRNSNGSQQLQRHFVYDNYQQLCKSIEPETGTTLYKYDGAGNLTRTDFGMPAFFPSPCAEPAMTAAAGPAMTAMDGPPTGGNNPPLMARYAQRTYDTRNRLKTLTFLDHNGDQTWDYTPDGLPRRIVTLNSEGLDSAINEYFYNKRRLLTRETLSQPDWYTWPVEYDYNGKGHLSGQSYPNGLYIDYDVNALGQPKQAGPFATGVQYYPNGAIKQFTYGNGIVHSMTQNTRQLPARSTDSGGVLNHEYIYDANGNTQYIYDHVNPALHRYMNYDGLDRLISVGSQVFGGDHWHRFTYNVLDYLTSWKLAGVKDYASYYYDPETNRLTNILNSAGASVVGFSYDRQGNLANKNGQDYLFDHGNRLREVSEKEGYHYDGHGRRIMGWRPDGGLNFSLYGQLGQLWYHEYDAKSLAVENVYLAGSLIASREYNWVANTFTTKYHHTDALGSPVAITNAAGQVTERTNWEPYGAAIGKPNYEGIGFTGHMHDAATGLAYMQQRYYDPTTGVFLSVDPVTAYEQPITAFNRYRYANNNPYKFTDPDGRFGRPDPPHMRITTETQTQNANGSVTVQRITSASDMAPPPPTGGKVVLLPQSSASGAPAKVGNAVKERLLNFSEKAGKSVEVTSGQRTTEQNTAVGGAPASQHLNDNAADIRIEGSTTTQTADAAHESGEFNRVNEYSNGRGVHVDLREDGNQGRFDDWRPRPNE